MHSQVPSPRYPVAVAVVAAAAAALVAAVAGAAGPICREKEGMKE